MYSRTSNQNGRFNSRCLYCFTTVASDIERTSELDRIEAEHLCPEKALAQLMARKHTIEIQNQTN
jgi:hypothetical protein